MPTPAKLVSALLFAALSWWVAETIVREVLPEGRRVGLFREGLAVLGLFVGWHVIGGEASGKVGRGTTISRAVTAGFAAALILLVLGLLLESLREMLTRSLDRAYTEVGQAANAWMTLLWRDAELVADPVVLGTLFGGGMLVGLVAGIVGRVWR